jgi:hypothetical protein
MLCNEQRIESNATQHTNKQASSSRAYRITTYIFDAMKTSSF